MALKEWQWKDLARDVSTVFFNAIEEQGKSLVRNIGGKDRALTLIDYLQDWDKALYKRVMDAYEGEPDDTLEMVKDAWEDALIGVADSRDSRYNTDYDESVGPPLSTVQQVEAIRRSLSEVSSKTIAGWHDAEKAKMKGGNEKAKVLLREAEKNLKAAISNFNDLKRAEPQLKDTIESYTVAHLTDWISGPSQGTVRGLWAELRDIEQRNSETEDD